MRLSADFASGAVSSGPRDANFEFGAHAPGGPGIAPTWASSAKDIVGCAIGPSRLWFTLGFGIINEVYYPRIDIPQIRDLGFIVSDGEGFWTEVKRLNSYKLQLLAPGTPAVEVVHTHERFILTLRVSPDPDRDVLVIEVALEGDESLRPYVLVAPHLGAQGHDNFAAIDAFGNWRVLAAEQGPFALALAAVDKGGRDAFGAMSAGYVGENDGWQDFARNGRLTWQYASAGPGNVAAIGQLTRSAVLGLGFASSSRAAATLAISSLIQPFGHLLERQIADWRGWHTRCRENALLDPDESDRLAEQLALSSMVLRAHRDKTWTGAMVASLSVPWGNSQTDREGGYHLVWPRDLVQCATALLALGAVNEARNTLQYLIATQKEDGSWSQNQWLGGTPYWPGLQLDEVAFPVLLADALAERDALESVDVGGMVQRALGFIAASGPASPQDRWEENAGINAFTLATCIAALVAGARFLPPAGRDFVLELADFWNAQVETWMAVRGTPLARRLGVDSYYIRVTPADAISNPSRLQASLEIRNRLHNAEVPADEEVSTDFLQLVRLGLRAADHPIVRGTVTIADALLKTGTPNGPVWHRYNGDGYGEHEDGRPFDGLGRGRAWPLLTGERGHFALIAGDDPSPYLEAMAAMAGPGGMLPEQVWDSPDIPSKQLFAGRPTGSAMPLAWAHAEFVKLMISRHLGHPTDRPTSVWDRYHGEPPVARSVVWMPQLPVRQLPRGVTLLLALPAQALIHWGVDGWQAAEDGRTLDTGIGLHVFQIGAVRLAAARQIDFTFRWASTGTWAGEDYRIEICEAGRMSP